jgi:hypothetical protein
MHLIYNSTADDFSTPEVLQDIPWLHAAVTSTSSRFYARLPKALFHLNRSMSALP